METSWYVTRVKTGQEGRAVFNLQQQSYEVYCPQAVFTQLRRSTSVKKALFPGYVFLKKQPHQSVSSVRSTFGVIDIVRFGGAMATVDGELIESLRTAERQLAAIEEVPAGGVVRVHSGPFAGLNAVYDQPDDEMRSFVFIELLGKRQRLRISNNDLRVG